MNNILCIVQSRVSNDRGHSRYISGKDLSRIRARITEIKEMVQTSKLHVKIMKEEAPNFLIKLIPKNKQTTKITIVEQTVSSFLFSPLP